MYSSKLVQMVNDTLPGNKRRDCPLSSPVSDSVVSNGSNLDSFSSDIFYDQKPLRHYFNIVDMFGITKYLPAMKCGFYNLLESSSVNV